MNRHAGLKAISLLLLLALLLPACAKEQAEGEAAAETPVPGQPEAAGEAAEPETKADYPFAPGTYGGYAFTFLNQEDDFWTGANHVLDYDEMTGDGLTDAVYTRNRDAEVRLDVKFEVIKGSLGQTNDMRKMMEQSVQAMEDAYDAVYLPLNWSNSTSFDGKTTLDLSKIESLRMGEDWWNSSFIRSASTGDGQLYTSVDYVNLMGYSFCNSMFFNRRMCAERGMDYPYEAAEDGKWTYDLMFSMMRNVIDIGTQTDWKPDLSGNAVSGIVGQHAETTVSLLLGSGCSIIAKNAENIPYINEDLTGLTDAYEKLLNALSQDGACMLINQAGCQGLDFFLRDRSLFYIGSIGGGSSARFRDSEAEYGVLPLPKKDETQKEYSCNLSMYTFALNIPLAASDPERTGAIIDYLAFMSYRDVLPVLQNNMCYKGVSDPVDIAMMNIVLDSETVDIGLIYGWTTNFLNDVCGENKMLAGNNTFASSWAGQQKIVKKNLEKRFGA